MARKAVPLDPVESESIKAAAQKAYEAIEGEGAVSRYRVLRSGPVLSSDGQNWEVEMYSPNPLSSLCLAWVNVDRKTGSCSVQIFHSIASALDERWRARVRGRGRN